MLNRITNNPYRFLGVYSNSPTKDRISHINRMRAFLNVGKEVTFPLDLNSLLPEINRDIEMIDNTTNSINQPLDQLTHALFWFIKGSPIDEMAFQHIESGNVAKGFELLGKREHYSALINLGVLSFIVEDNDKAIQCITKVIHTSNYRESFIEAVCGSTFVIQENDLAKLFIESLIKEIPINNVKELLENHSSSFYDRQLINEIAVKESAENINTAIAKTKNVNSEDSEGQLKAGTRLMNSTKKDLQTIKSVLETTDVQYQMIADNLAKHILQCGINYINNTDEDDDISIDKAMKLQNYALNIAVGQLTRDRCQENVNILKKRKADLPPSIVKTEANAVLNELVSFCKKPDLIVHSITLLNNTKPHLYSIKTKLGESDAYYLKLSSLVVNNALHNLIEEVNAKQKDPVILYSLQSGIVPETVKYILRNAWNAIKIMDELDKDASTKSRYNTNRNTLKGMCSQMGIYTTTSSYNYGGGYRSSSNNSSSSDNSSWGCWIFVIIIIIIYILSNLSK